VADLIYSTEALNAKSAFYRAKAMVYVEGDEDVLFWDELFSKVPEFSVVVESVGGSGELDKYITRIEAGELDAIAARDADFLRYQGLIAKTARVIYTFGYSMENSVYTADIVHHVARSWCKSPALTNAQCAQWLNELGTAFAPLIELDVANAIGNSGAAVLADNCTRFMTGQASAKPCPNRITIHATEVATKISKRAVGAAKKELANSPSGSVDNLRGHLLATAVVKFLLQTAKNLGKKINVSMDSLYATAISNFARAFGPTHPHHAYYTTATDGAAATFQ
jgi:Protein of unknown function (DUF4435)